MIVRVRAAALAAGLLLACGSERAGPELALRRLALRPSGSAVEAAPAPQVVSDWGPFSHLAWRVLAGDLVPEPGADEPRLVLRPDGPDRPIRLLREARLDLTAFDHVRLRVGSSGDARVSVGIVQDGAVVAETDPVVIPRRDDLSPVEVLVPVPWDLAERGRASGLVLNFGDWLRDVLIEDVQLVRVPAASRVPDPAAGPRLVEVDGEARLAVGLTGGRPLETRAHVARGDRLRFSLGRVPTGPPGDDTLRVTVRDDGRRDDGRHDDGRHDDGRHDDGRHDDGRREGGGRDDGGRSEVATFPLAETLGEGGSWRTLEVTLEAFAGRDVAVSFALQGGSALLVAEPELRRSASVPRTVLLVTTDTHRGDHLGLAGRGVDVLTPNLDALARDGVFFEDCFAPANFTNPSHSALMTGVHPRDTGILDNQHALAAAAPTLAEAFADAGFVTWAALSARHLGDAVSGLGQGFDRVSWPDAPQRPSEETVAIATGWLADAVEQDLFLWLHVFDAHMPYDPPAGFDRMYYDGPEDPFPPGGPALDVDPLLPEGWKGVVDLEFPRAQYRAMVTALDDRLGRLLSLPRFADAVVAVVGDHGENLGAHDIYFNHGELYPDTLHVPLILDGPGVPAGERRRNPVRALDVGRTLLDLAGLESAPFPGRSLLALDAGAPRFAISSHGSSAAITVDGLHLVLHLIDHHERFARHSVELYDLRDDPGATVDLVGTRPEDARRLAELLVAWLSAADDRGWVGDGVQDPAVLEQLRQLGYVDAAPDVGSLWEPDDCSACRRWR